MICGETLKLRYTQSRDKFLCPKYAFYQLAVFWMTRIRTNGSKMIEVNTFWRTKMRCFVVVVEIVIFCRNTQNIEFQSILRMRFRQRMNRQMVRRTNPHVEVLRHI